MHEPASGSRAADAPEDDETAFDDPRAPREPSAGDRSRLLQPSKTRRKQESHDLQSLGEALVVFSDAQLDRLALSEALVDAIRACRRIKAHEARRRQMQLIGKLMRSADVAPVREAVAAAQLGPARDALALHRAERWRAELLADDEATTRFAREHPGADLQQLRALVRNARRDASRTPEARSGRAYRELFQLVRAHAGDE